MTTAPAQRKIFHNQCGRCWVIFRKQQLVDGLYTSCRLHLIRVQVKGGKAP